MMNKNKRKVTNKLKISKVIKKIKIPKGLTKATHDFSSKGHDALKSLDDAISSKAKLIWDEISSIYKAQHGHAKSLQKIEKSLKRLFNDVETLRSRMETSSKVKRKTKKKTAKAKPKAKAKAKAKSKAKAKPKAKN